MNTATIPSIGHCLANLLARHGEPINDDVRRLLDKLCDSVLRQHSCLDLSAMPEETAPQLKSLACVGDGDDNTPLVLYGERLYLQRYFVWEKSVAAMLSERNRPQACDHPERLGEELDLLFPPGSERNAAARHQVETPSPPEGKGRGGGNDIDWQRVAALQALTRRLLIITGGPGTGKTRTVVKIIALLLALSAHEPVIRLAAPTGKAAMRLKDSIREGISDLPKSFSMLADQVSTLHRLLGMRSDGRSWRHDADNPIDADVLIVDEASMIDLPMAYRMLSALPPDSRLILLGDADQLPSVDVGNVLADLCSGTIGYSGEFVEFARKFVHGDLPGAENKHKLMDAVCRFERNYRFAPDSGIGRLAREIREGTASFEVSSGPDDASVRYLDLAGLRAGNPAERLVAFFDDYIRLLETDEKPDVPELLKVFEQTRILCARREGFAGVINVNRALEAILEQRGLKRQGQDFYTGRPVMITRNDYNLELFNGDIGICVPGTDGEFLVAFPDAQGGIKYELALRLAHQETCFAMTVHKSQGSEFDHLVLLLDESPESFPEQLQTRALLYTAATRAKNRITIYGNADIWRQALENTSARMSGLQTFVKNN